MPPTLWLILLRTPNFFCSKEYQKSLQIGSFNCFSTDKTSPWALAEKNSGVISWSWSWERRRRWIIVWPLFVLLNYYPALNGSNLWFFLLAKLVEILNFMFPFSSEYWSESQRQCLKISPQFMPFDWGYLFDSNLCSSLTKFERMLQSLKPWLKGQVKTLYGGCN